MMLAIALGLVVNAGFVKHATRVAPPVAWSCDYAASLAESERTGRLLLVVFECPECIWCVKLDEHTWRNNGVRQFVADGCVALKIDGEQNQRLAKKLWVRRYPTLIIAAPDGTILSFGEGFVEPITMQLRLRRAAADAAARRQHHPPGGPGFLGP
jgi:hypothetical protein